MVVTRKPKHELSKAAKYLEKVARRLPHVALSESSALNIFKGLISQLEETSGIRMQIEADLDKHFEIFQSALSQPKDVRSIQSSGKEAPLDLPKIKTLLSGNWTNSLSLYESLRANPHLDDRSIARLLCSSVDAIDNLGAAKLGFVAERINRVLVTASVDHNTKDPAAISCLWAFSSCVCPSARFPFSLVAKSSFEKAISLAVGFLFVWSNLTDDGIVERNSDYIRGLLRACKCAPLDSEDLCCFGLLAGLFGNLSLRAEIIRILKRPQSKFPASWSTFVAPRLRDGGDSLELPENGDDLLSESSLQKFCGSDAFRLHLRSKFLAACIEMTYSTAADTTSEAQSVGLLTISEDVPEIDENVIPQSERSADERTEVLTFAVDTVGEITAREDLAPQVSATIGKRRRRGSRSDSEVLSTEGNKKELENSESKQALGLETEAASEAAETTLPDKSIRRSKRIRNNSEVSVGSSENEISHQSPRTTRRKKE